MEKNVGKIENRLEEHGYELRAISSSGKDVKKIGNPSKDAEYNPEALYELLTQDDFAIKIYHLILYLSEKEDGFVDIDLLRRYVQARIDDNHLQKVSNSCPLTTKICPKCENYDFMEIGRNGDKIYRCSNGCGDLKKSQLKELDFWEGIGSSDIFNRVEKLAESGFIVESYQKKCHKCDSLEVGTEEISPQCDGCGSLCDLMKTYSPRNLTVSNIEGVWLEWLCYEMLSECGDMEAYCLPRNVGRKEDFHTEVDGIFLRDGKITVVDAKAKNIKDRLSKDEIPNSIMEWQNFADKIIVVTTSTVGRTGKNTFRDNVENAEVDFIEGSELIELSERAA